MSRIKIDLPDNFSFSASIPVRITDLNYGGHVGNDAVLSLIHEARMQYLKHYGYAELDFAGIGLIMRDVGIEFKNELFYGDVVTAFVTATNFTSLSFDLVYKLVTSGKDGKTAIAAVAKTGMVGYDYQKKKVAAIPEQAKASLSVSR
jgi:acyl-CoA thioester hydrolase